MICGNLKINERGHLSFAGQDTVELAKRYGTPLYLMDEAQLRKNCRLYKEAFARCFKPGSVPYYASKALSFRHIYRIMAEEGMNVDVVSCGELVTAAAAGFDMKKVCFHGNNKTDADIRLALKMGVGIFAVDNEEELRALDREAAAFGCVQEIWLRITPGIDTHTYEAVNTGKVDSKFGNAIATGQAEAMVRLALSLPHIKLVGLHCHVGSQVFAEDVFERTAEVMLHFLAELREKLGFEAEQLDLGGGYGVRYVESDPEIDIPAKIASVAETVHSVSAKLGIREPMISMEPGRSIVADAGLTLYTVGSVKRIPDYKTYVSVDGGMTDNPRYALYGSRYTVFNASRAAEPAKMRCDLAGRCCESGDIIQPDVLLPEATARGDIAAVAVTGAYNYAMASHYNRVPKPPVVMLKDGESYEAVRRETFEDLCRCDI